MDGVSSDRIRSAGGDDTPNLAGSVGAGVVVVEIGHRVARDGRALATGDKNACDLLAGVGDGRVDGVETVGGGGATDDVITDRISADSG